jgi:ABC-type multidrug transport system fused ATPase/permease subunit
MTLFLQLASSLSGSFSALVSLVPSAIIAATAAGRIMELTRIPTENTVHQEEIQELLKNGNGIRINAENVDFSYQNGKTIFKDVNFYADAGEIVAFVGPSGGGKTTLLRLLLGMMTIQKGNIALCDDLSGSTFSASPSTRKLFAYVPQDNTLFSGSIADNLTITNPEATEDMLIEALKTACAYDFVSALPDGVYTRVGENGNKLSKGQIQRISIARALLSDAPILLLDEATSALDVKTEREMLKNVMNAKKGRTCIITTHKASVLSICRRAYVINNQSVTPTDKEQAENLMKNI